MLPCIVVGMVFARYIKKLHMVKLEKHKQMMGLCYADSYETGQRYAEYTYHETGE